MTTTDRPRLDRPTEVLAHLHARRRDPTYAPNSLVILLAGGDATPIMGLAIEDLPLESPPQHVRIETLVPLLRHVAHDSDDVAAFVLVVCRPGLPHPEGDDYAWHDVAIAAATAGGPPCLGVYVQTPRGAAPVLARAA